jgi:hypothetical protein
MLCLLVHPRVRKPLAKSGADDRGASQVVNSTALGGELQLRLRVDVRDRRLDVLLGGSRSYMLTKVKRDRISVVALDWGPRRTRDEPGGGRGARRKMRHVNHVRTGAVLATVSTTPRP